MTAAGGVGAGAANGAAGTIFVKSAGNGVLTIDNGGTVGALYTRLPQVDYSGTPVDQIVLKNQGSFYIPSNSTFSVTSSIVADGNSDQLTLDGKLNTPATVAISSFTMFVSSWSWINGMTYLDLGYGMTMNLYGLTPKRRSLASAA